MMTMCYPVSITEVEVFLELCVCVCVCLSVYTGKGGLMGEQGLWDLDLHAVLLNLWSGPEAAGAWGGRGGRKGRDCTDST